MNTTDAEGNLQENSVNAGAMFVLHPAGKHKVHQRKTQAGLLHKRVRHHPPWSTRPARVPSIL